MVKMTAGRTVRSFGEDTWRTSGMTRSEHAGKEYVPGAVLQNCGKVQQGRGAPGAFAGMRALAAALMLPMAFWASAAAAGTAPGEEGSALSSSRSGSMLDGSGQGTDGSEISAGASGGASGDASAECDESGKFECEKGVNYYYGRGVPKDPETALLWLHRARDKGSIKARLLLAELEAAGLRDELKTAGRDRQQYGEDARSAGDAGFVSEADDLDAEIALAQKRVRQLEKMVTVSDHESEAGELLESGKKQPLDAKSEIKRQKLEELKRKQQELEKLLSTDNPEPEAGNPEKSEKKQAADGELKKKMHELEELIVNANSNCR